LGGVLAAEDFDDGRTDVPGGVAGAVERVLVVGAGIAGLAVANALTHAGVECVVLEGRDRAGGPTPSTWAARPSTWAGHGFTCRTGTR